MSSTKPIKVARVISRLNIGGPSIHVTLLTKGLSPDFDTVLISGVEAEHEGDMRFFAESHGVTPVFVSQMQREINVLGDLSTIWKLMRIFRRERPAIVHTHTAKAGLAGRIAARLTGVPIVVHTFHGHVFQGYFGRFKTSIFIWIERLLARLTDRIVTLSESQRADIVELGISDMKKTTVIPLGLDLARLESTPDNLRPSWGVAADAFVVGIVGRLTDIKNHDMFLRVATHFRDRDDMRFVIVGDGELRSVLETRAQALGIASKVVFVGWQKDVASVYHSLDLVVLTSKNEGTPLAVIEAMMAGKPVVATDVGGVGDVISDGETGCLTPPDDDVAMAEKIIQLLRDPALCAQMGSQAAKVAKRRYRSERLVDDIRGLYMELLRGKGITQKGEAI